MTGRNAAAAAAIVFAITTLSITSINAQPVEPCRGPFAKCVTQVGGWCEPNGKGGQHITFWSKSGYSAMFEECVGKVHEANGRPNPYKPASAQKPKPAR
jgi:hypothetical protein